MKKTNLILQFVFTFICSAYSQNYEEKSVINFYPIKVIDTVYKPDIIEKIKVKDYFYDDETSKNSNLFLCSIKRKHVNFEDQSPTKQKTLIKKINDFWVMYDFEEYWGIPEKRKVDNTFYVLKTTEGNAGNNGAHGSWNWGKNSVYFLDFERMTTSEEIIASYGLYKSYLKNEEHIEKDNSSEADKDYTLIITEKECSIQYKIEKLRLVIDEEFCKNETSHKKGDKIEFVERGTKSCPCVNQGNYQYINGNFLREND